MLFSVEQAFVGRDEKRAPLKTPAWEATPKVEVSETSHVMMWIPGFMKRETYRIMEFIVHYCHCIRWPAANILSD